VCAALAAALALVTDEPAAGAGERPNIVLITTDDQTAESMQYMRRTRKLLGERGTTFENMIATFPLCCPARATWITGQYAHNHGVVDNQERNGGGYGALRDPVKVLPVWLQLAGYETVLIGKWLHDYHSLMPPPGWSRWHGLIPPTVTRYFGYEIADSVGGKLTAGKSDSDYLTDALTRRFAVPFIYGQATNPDPFFLHLSYTAPHWGKGRADKAGKRCANGKPFTFDTARAKPAPRHATKFRRTQLPPKPSFDERNISDKPGSIRGRRHLDERAESEITERYRCELAALASVDQGVKQISEALAATGQADNTYVIFTSDNGYMHGEHRVRAEKVQPYEEALRVPFIIRGPNVPAGQSIADPVANVDLVPTLMELAGATQPALLGREIDGVSLVQYLTGARHPGRAILIEAKRPPRQTPTGGIVAPSFVGVRTARYTYVEHYRTDAATLEEGFGLPIGVGGLTDRELYDLHGDPYQLRSRHGGSAYAGPRTALVEALQRLRFCGGAECVLEPAIPEPSG
jgi:arylsulfatase A-like enzyme